MDRLGIFEVNSFSGLIWNRFALWNFLESHWKIPFNIYPLMRHFNWLKMKSLTCYFPENWVLFQIKLKKKKRVKPASEWDGGRRGTSAVPQPPSFQQQQENEVKAFLDPLLKAKRILLTPPENHFFSLLHRAFLRQGHKVVYTCMHVVLNMGLSVDMCLPYPCRK